MKRTITSAVLLLMAAPAMAQTSSYAMSLENSAVKYYIGNNGTFFNNISTATGGYLVPKDSSTSAIYMMAIEALGTDAGGQLKGAIATYTASDFFPGPIATDYNDPAYTDRYEWSIWIMFKDVVDYHIAHWQDAGYVPNAMITNWPGNGNVANGEAQQLAPFFDVDNDGGYNPLMGDYPLIRGDQALFTIMNDRAGIHPSGSNPIGLEVHLLFYQYDAPNDPTLNSTTFINTTLINRGTLTLQDFRFGTFIDFDLGGYADDYVGTLPDKNLAYVYNGDLIDQSQNGLPGYGELPPAVGVMTLGKPLYSHVNLTTGSNGIPTTSPQYNNVLQGLGRYGDILLDNNGQPTRYCYTSTSVAGWNENTVGNPPGDRRTNISFAPEIFQPEAILCYDYAVIYARSGESDLFASADSLAGTADHIATFFDNKGFPCLQSVLGEEEQELPVYEVFPNPAIDVLTISGTGQANFRIVTPDGKTILEGKNSNGAVIDVSALHKGYYLLVLTDDRSEQTISFLKQ